MFKCHTSNIPVTFFSFLGRKTPEKKKLNLSMNGMPEYILKRKLAGCGGER